MNTIKTTLTTEACFSDDGLKRYLLRKTWGLGRRQPLPRRHLEAPSAIRRQKVLGIVCFAWF